MGLFLIPPRGIIFLENRYYFPPDKISPKYRRIIRKKHIKWDY
jgi:hypothetical protein